MLKNIRLHIEKDEDKQKLLDEKLAATILECQKNSLNSFARNIPSLLPFLESSDLQNHSLFCNKFGEINIVDYGLGRTLYGFHPQKEIQQQVKVFNQHAPYFSLVTEQTSKFDLDEIKNSTTLVSSEGVINRSSFSPCPEEIECLVILGCGLGLHILDLMQSKKIKYLIIYEPQPQYFKCSTLATPWNKIFEIAKTKDTQIFIQVEKDGRDLVSDIQELKTHTDIQGFYLYKHYNHAVFNSLHKELTTKSWATLTEQGISFTLTENYNQYVPIWTPPIDLDNNKDVAKNSKLFSNNLLALKRYFPAIHKEFKDYQPKTWLPIENQQGEINLIKKDSLNTWYGEHPKKDCESNFENFNEQPNKDGLILGYSGTKLAHYIHYQFVKETEKLLEQAENETGALPENVPSIIMFGIGVGYQIEKLLAEHTVEKLFLCEPNTDFFYASLFAIDWQVIFEKIEQSDARIYLNIGDDGTNLFRDLLSQFYSIGPYILNNTYFYQSYYNASLNKAISQLREQLQVVISMGEYFDHAYYGIAHTIEGMRRKTPVLSANPAEKLSYDDKEVPIFIVGNGPSLDSSIEAIKEWRDQAIIVSCGTALQALHRHGITPDFHAEIEQNRSTFDWAVLVGDLDYLKNITLLSCNGIHPDTCDLYKDVMVAFKEGESSTISALNVLGRENFEVLENAFPTVSNFVCDLISQLGFSTIYLIGVDLGFVNVKHHHSKSSGYYQEDGEETYNYAEKNNTSLVVPGNFRPTVNTKHEFKVSRQVIEQVTAAKPKTQSIYNCSDGAKIRGTLPIRPDNLLIVSTSEQKQHTIKQLKTVIFSTEGLDNYVERFEKQFSQELLKQELEALEKLLDKNFETSEDVSNLINTQKEMLFASYQKGQSLLFYYMYGTVNYTNAVAEKIHHNLELFNQLVTIWKSSLKKINTLTTIPSTNFDRSNYREVTRGNLLLRKLIEEKSILIMTNSSAFAESIQWAIKNTYKWFKTAIIVSPENLDNTQRFDFVLIYVDESLAKNENATFELQSLPTAGTINTLLIVNRVTNELKHKIPTISIMLKPHGHSSEEKKIHNLFVYANNAIKACIDSPLSGVVIPRLKYLNNHKINKFTPQKVNIKTKSYTVRFSNYSVIPFAGLKANNYVSRLGYRGDKINNLDNNNIYLFQHCTEQSLQNAISQYKKVTSHLFSDKKFDSTLNLKTLRNLPES